MKTRSNELELMDVETPAPEERARVAGYLSFVNRWLGGTRAVLRQLHGSPTPMTVLDVGAGDGDLVRDLARRVPGLVPVAFDLAPWALGMADGLARVNGDAFRFPFRDKSVDWVIATHFFHHLSDDEIVATLREFDRVARRGLVVNDLRRSRMAVVGITLLTLFANRFAKKDGALSVRRGFTARELERYASHAGLGFLRVRSHFACRLTLAGGRTSEAAA